MNDERTITPEQVDDVRRLADCMARAAGEQLPAFLIMAGIEIAVRVLRKAGHSQAEALEKLVTIISSIQESQYLQ